MVKKSKEEEPKVEVAQTVPSEKKADMMPKTTDTMAENAPETTEPPGSKMPEETAKTDEMPEMAQEETAQEEAEPESNDAKVAEIIQRFYPDADVSTPEAIVSSSLPLLLGLVQLHDNTTEVIDEFPEFGDFYLAVTRKGMSPQEAYLRYLDDPSFEAPEGSPDYEKNMKAKEERQKMLSEKSARLQKISENEPVTQKNFQEVVSELNLDEAQTASLEESLKELFIDFNQDGLIKKENLMKLATGLIHDNKMNEKEKEMEAAVEDAKTAGRNEQIEKKRMKKETGDGLPNLNSGGKGPDSKAPRKPLLDIKPAFRV